MRTKNIIKKRIAFFSPKPFGQWETPGTYKLVEALSRYYDIRIFSPPFSEKLCVYRNDALPLIPTVDNVFFSPDGTLFTNALVVFRPDVVYMFNSRLWTDYFLKIRAALPEAKYILDIKTPLLIHEKAKKDIQIKGNEHNNTLDLILTLSKANVPTWIPKFSAKVVEYPLGVNKSIFKQRKKIFSQTNKHFVLVSTIHEKRKINILIDGFVRFARKTPGVHLDIYGYGQRSYVAKLELQIAALDAADIVSLRGLVSQEQLFALLPDYDLGIAWVPLAEYMDSPSLKILEYMAVGLPTLATATSAHKKLLEQGCSFHLTEDNAEALAATLAALPPCCDLIDVANGNSALVAKMYGHETIAYKYIMPNIESILLNNSRLPSIIREAMADVGTTVESEAVLIMKPSRPLKLLLHISTLSTGKGGAERVAMELACEMRRRGHQVYIVYKKHSTVFPSYSGSEDIVFLPYERLSQLTYLIININPSTVLGFYFNKFSLLEILLSMINLNTPLCIQECTNPYRLINNNWRKGNTIVPDGAWERDVLTSRAARIRLTMPEYAESFSPYIRRQVRCFPNPAPRQSLRAETRGLDLPWKEILLLNGFKPNKNFLPLIHAFALLAERFPDWRLKVLGSIPALDKRNAYHEEIFSTVESCRIADRVMFEPAADDVFPHYARAQIHVIASLSEGCPTVVLEAMSVGLPSIGYADCCGTNQLIRHGENGLLADPTDRVEGLRAALERLMSSASLRVSMGARALEDSAKYAPEQIYDQWEQLFYEAAEFGDDPEKLFREQAEVSREHALHARRMRNALLSGELG